MTHKSNRQRSERHGRRGEHLAALYLRIKGYRIKARNVRTPVGEIDLIAQRGRQLAFIEVKVRPSLEEAKAAIHARQRDRIERAAQFWLQKKGLSHMPCRFDAICIAKPWSLTHIKNAWAAR